MINRLKSIICGKGKDVVKESVTWNMVFSIMGSLQSAVMILIVTRIIGTEDAGILSIAYATAYLMFTIGSYGVRNFHATDTQRDYTYIDYRRMRLISGMFMVVTSLVYCSLKQYSVYKFSVVLAVCILKFLEVIEDLYHGELQRKGRLDIAGRAGALRLFISYIAFIVIAIVTENLLITINITIFVSIITVFFTRYLYSELLAESMTDNHWNKVKRLLWESFPLFLTQFLSIYICNSPKYAIDACLFEEEQAYYAIISMPVFTINLLSGIIYRPKLFILAKWWNEGNKSKFVKVVIKQIGGIAAISGLILVGGLTVGLRLLEILYGVPLNTLKMEFAILLLGGGMVALYNFLTACIIVMRKQAFMLGLSVFMLLLTYAISYRMVNYAGLTGAAWLYFILMACEMMIVSVAFVIYLVSAD